MDTLQPEVPSNHEKQGNRFSYEWALWVSVVRKGYYILCIFCVHLILIVYLQGFPYVHLLVVAQHNISTATYTFF